MATETLVAAVKDANTDTGVQADTPTQTWSTDLAQYEDGQRVAITNDTFEWWYFDTILDDGSTCVINFLNKKNPSESGPLLPNLQLNISTPAGRVYQKEISFDPGSYSSSSDHCKVAMGPNRVEGNLRTYELHVEADDLRADLQLDVFVPGWRTGPYLPPPEAAKEWLGEQIVIPSGTVQGTLRYEGASHEVKGTCYHDHQWGSVVKTQGPWKLTKWYWGRACIESPSRIPSEKYSIVFAQVLGSYEGSPEVPVGALFMLARGTGITFDDSLGALSVKLDSVGCHLKWTSNQGEVTLDLKSPQEIANLYHGSYLRYLSPAVLTSNFAGPTFTGTGKAIWEIKTF